MNKTIKLKIIIGAFLLILSAIGVFVWLGNKTPQTGLQHLSSLAGLGRPTSDAASQTVFLGDSITAQEDWNVLFHVSYIANAGISGDTTDEILARLDQAIAGKPQRLFLMAGINDLIKEKDVSYVLTNYRKILDRIAATSPGTEIYIQSVLPVNNIVWKYGHVENGKIVDLNAGLKLLAAEKHLLFIDLYPHFCGSDNNLYPRYTSDGLHPNSHGYAVWKKLVLPYVQK